MRFAHLWVYRIQYFQFQTALDDQIFHIRIYNKDTTDYKEFQICLL